MGRTPIRAKLVLDAEAKAKLESIAKSRTEGQARIERANVLLAYHAGERVTALAEAFHTNRPKIERILNRALEMGALASLEDRPGAVLSLDEKPGIQAIGKVAPDLPPVQGKYASNGRDYEYKRHGTLSLLAGLDLLTGKVHACIEERHRSLEFTKLLEQIHQAYSAETRILIVLSLDSLVCAAGTGGQPFSPHLEGNPGLPQDAAQPFRIRVHSQARVLAESGGSLFRQDDQDHPSGNTGCIEGRVEGPNHALSPGSQRRPGRIQVALQARRRVGVIRLSCFFFFYLLHPRSSPSSPSNNRWGKRNASYWRSSTFKSKSPLPVHGLMLKRRTWIFALPKLTNRQVASLVPRM